MTVPSGESANVTADRPTFVTHLECSLVGDHYEADQLHGVSKAGKPLLVRYDLEAVKAAVTASASARPPWCAAKPGRATYRKLTRD